MYHYFGFIFFGKKIDYGQPVIDLVEVLKVRKLCLENFNFFGSDGVLWYKKADYGESAIQFAEAP